MSSTKQFFLSFLICLAAFGLLGYLITGLVEERFFAPTVPNAGVQNPDTADISNPLPEDTDTGVGFTALLIGKDTASNEIDALILLRVEKEQKKVSVCSIPADTRYAVTGTDSSGNSYSGSLTFKDTEKSYGLPYLLKKVYALTDQKVDYYAQISLSAARTLLSELTGSTGLLYTVPETMEYEEEDGAGIHLKEGSQYLSGAKAVELLRYRTYNSGNGDVKRCTTQVDFLRRLISDTLTPDNPLKEKLLSESERKRLLSYVNTNVTSEDIVKHLDLVFSLHDFEFVSIPFRYSGLVKTENVSALHDTFNDPFLS